MQSYRKIDAVIFIKSFFSHSFQWPKTNLELKKKIITWDAIYYFGCFILCNIILFNILLLIYNDIFNIINFDFIYFWNYFVTLIGQYKYKTKRNEHNLFEKSTLFGICFLQQNDIFALYHQIDHFVHLYDFKIFNYFVIKIKLLWRLNYFLNSKPAAKTPYWVK